MIERDSHAWQKGLPTLGAIWLVSALIDRLWTILDQQMPAWDQAEYLAGALEYWRVLQTPQWLSHDWWTAFWQLSPKTPPLVAISTTPFLSLLGAGPDQSTCVNLLYSLILLGAVYGLGCYLFTTAVGLWAAGLCVLMPGLYRVRLDYLLDHPLTAMVTLSFTCLTLWRGKPWRQGLNGPTVSPSWQGLAWARSHLAKWLRRKPTWALPFVVSVSPTWLLAIALGLCVGLALLVKQSALLFLLVPLTWAGGEVLWRRQWGRVGSYLLAAVIAIGVVYPWFRTNWLLILTGSKRATIDSAIAEGDPSLLSIDAWIFYLKHLPQLVSLPLLLVGLLGLLCFWRRSRVSSQWLGEADYAPKSVLYRDEAFLDSRAALSWLLVFLGGAYLLSSLNINKDLRYAVPLLPVLSIILAYGLTLLPRSWRWLKWSAVAVASVLLLVGLFPLLPQVVLPNPMAMHRAVRLNGDYPQARISSEVIKTAPYLRSTIGVLPSTPEVNQHNINYYGNLRDFQVYGRQVGTRAKQTDADRRSLSWFLTKTGDPGSIRHREAFQTLVQSVEQQSDFRLHATWNLPDASQVKLYHRRTPAFEVQPLERPAAAAPIQLTRIEVPEQVPPGQPVPVSYTWVGDWTALQPGLVLLTWRNLDTTLTGTTRWFHDHGLAMGNLYPAHLPRSQTTTTFQVQERLAMLPPADAVPGQYTLEAIYLNRQTGAAQMISVPTVRLQIEPEAPATAAPELDLVTQLQQLAITLPQGMKALDRLFDEVARINQYDPDQDYVTQASQAMAYRLQQEPNNRIFAYTLALAQVLKQRVEPAIAALQQVVTLDPNNAYAHAYLAFVNLYDFRAHAAQTSLDRALQLNPQSAELHALNGVAALMQGRLVRAWQEIQPFLAPSPAASG